jgi:hypothetical protein
MRLLEDEHPVEALAMDELASSSLEQVAPCSAFALSSVPLQLLVISPKLLYTSSRLAHANFSSLHQVSENQRLHRLHGHATIYR